MSPSRRSSKLLPWLPSLRSALSICSSSCIVKGVMTEQLPVGRLTLANLRRRLVDKGMCLSTESCAQHPHSPQSRCNQYLAQARDHPGMQATSTVCYSRKLEIWSCTQLFRRVDDHDPTISYHHLVLRCVQFDEDAAIWNVAPLVYAEDTSVNGTVLTREYPAEDGSTILLDHKLNNSMGPVLLQDGDRLYFSKSTFVQYSETSPHNDFNMSFVMDCEVKVGCFRMHNSS